MTQPIVSTTDNGTIRLEWRLPNCLASLDFEPDGTTEVIFTTTGHPSTVIAFDDSGSFPEWLLNMAAARLHQQELRETNS